VHKGERKVKTQKFLIGLLVLIVAVVAACAPAPAPTPVPTAKPTVPSVASSASATDLIAVANAYVDTANSGDLDKALAFYADDAIANTGVGLFIGKVQIGKWLANDIKTTKATPVDWKMQGALVVSTGSVALDRFTKIGITAVNYRSDYLIDKNGKIRYFGPIVTLTPDQQQKMRDAQASAPPAPTPSMNPIDVAKAYVDAANSGDFDKAYAFYADDSGAFVMNGSLLLTSKQQIGDLWLKDDVKTTRATAKDWQMNGNSVIATGTVSLDRFKKMGIDSVVYVAQYVIENGKIRFFYPTLQFTPDQAAKVQAAQQAQGAPTK
jgi:ketosteroid isomerase-like protein